MSMEDPINLYLNLDHWQDSDHGEDDPDPNPNPNNPADPPSPSASEFVLSGFVLVNIVGLQHYSGRIGGREMVGLVREPLNPYDPNAIKVLNMRTAQVGHIERASAAVLAPLIDAGTVIVEGIVPNTPGGGKNRFKLPCQVHVFCRRDVLPIVQAQIGSSGLVFYSSSDALVALSESEIVREKKGKKEIRSVDEIFKLVGAGEDKKEDKEKTAMEPPKDVITSDLFLHQKEGLGWLVHRENCQDLPPFWEEKNGVYTNVLTNYQTDKRPEPMRGGILADDMGLGKTLTLLSLIATNKPEYASSSSLKNDILEEEIESKSKGKRGKKTVSSRKKRKVSDTSCDKKGEGEVGPKTTLVVCPPVVFATWISQLSEHTKPGSFKVYMYYKERTQDVRELQKYDLVLTTYSTLAAETNWEGSPMKKMEWFRVILDEAHLIKNANAQQSKAVIALKAKRRWVVTGTPIQNGSLDLFSLMAFLKFEPFSIKSYWLALVQRPLSQGNESGLSRLQILMAAISLRRVKENTMIGLPPKTTETCFVELFAAEREMYDQMEIEAKSLVQDYIRVGSVMRNYSTVLSIILRLRQICDDVALYPDMKSLLPSNNIEDVSNNPELLKKLVAMLQDGDDFDCPICISPPSNTVITRCAHVFCRTCILKALKRPKPTCPLCRQTLSESDLFSAPPESSDSDSTTVSSKETSSKVTALLQLLVADRKQDPSTKSVIFSQFRKMLILLEGPLKASGFSVLRLDGSMTAKKRAEVINEFANTDSGSPTVLLASIKASGAGINLTAASRVYLLEPWWNPAVEEQAMDRVHRIGQTKDVKIVRLITKDSIEERILELQDKKKKLAREAFRKRNGKDSRQIGVEDLRMLMAL